MRTDWKSLEAKKPLRHRGIILNFTELCLTHIKHLVLSAAPTGQEAGAETGVCNSETKRPGLRTAKQQLLVKQSHLSSHSRICCVSSNSLRSGLSALFLCLEYVNVECVSAEPEKTSIQTELEAQFQVGFIY